MSLKDTFISILMLLVFSAISCGASSGSTNDPISPRKPASTTNPQQSSNPRFVSIKLINVVSGLNQPINVASPKDGSNRIFVVQKPGVVRIVKNGVLLPTPFLDISNLALTTGSEQGLLDIVFHPKYATNGYFFVNFTAKAGNGDTVIARYKVSAANPDVADPTSAKLILTFDQPYANHNGGKMSFGPDGYLYIGTGDGGSGGDPFGNGQNLNTFLGKILRLNIDVANDSVPYEIPPSNPFVSGGGYPEIWAYGLRNPWQFSFDRKTGDMYIADVGQNKWEEVDFQPASSTGGENYGWNKMEGFHCYPTDPCGTTGILPVVEYGHNEGCSIIGFGIYRGATYPILGGVYYFGDYCTGVIWGLQRLSSGKWVSNKLLDTTYNFTGAGEDENGDLYVTSSTTTTGDLWMIAKAP